MATTTTVLKMLIALPWFMIVAVGVFTGVLDADVAVSDSIRFWASDCLKLGYAYVAMTLVGMALLQKAGLIRE